MSDNITPPISGRMVIEPVTATPATRRLTAILLADVVGYSGMMSRDEDGTHARVIRQVRELIDLTIGKHGGRSVRSMGDGTLVVFASALDAVRCGLDIQRGLAERQADGSDRVRLRIGINTGDVLADDRDIYGNSVNIAARLQTLATPGTVYVSHSIYDQTRSHPDLFFADRGQHRVKNIPYPLHVFEVAYKPIRVSILARLLGSRARLAAMATVSAMLVASATTMLINRDGGGERLWQLVSHLFSLSQVIREVQAPALLPDKRSIAVLPFLNMSSDPEQEYFSDGMTEDLITELSRLTGLFVIARNSVYTFKGRAVKTEQVSRELGVRYVVEGSVRKANNRIRITAQLIDANTGYHVWAQYYDRDLHDVFAVQEEIARRITSALAVKLTKDEEKHMGRPYTSSEVAWEYFMRGAELFRRFTPKDNANARDLFEKAIGLDRSLQGRMQFWPPPIGKITMAGGVRTPNLQRTSPIAWRKRRLSWREASSNLSLRCHLLSNKWAGFSCTERNMKRPGRRQRRRSNTIPTTRMAMPYGRKCLFIWVDRNKRLKNRKKLSTTIR
jgi:adenylate cyclase